MNIETKRQIVGFHQDEVEDWVAELACGHQRHVRHNPPWTNHPWVTMPAGRQSFVGVAIECKYCNEEISHDPVLEYLDKQGENKPKMKQLADHQEDKELSAQHQLAETIRAACIQAALAGYEDAGLSGLCHEGAWECAIDAIRSLNINAILEQAGPDLR